MKGPPSGRQRPAFGGPRPGASPARPAARPERAQAVEPATLVLIGAATGAFGVRGEVRVRSFTAEPEAICSYGPLYDAEGRLVFTPLRWRAIKDGLAVTAAEALTREQAEALRNTALHVPRNLLPPAGEDEYYHVDLIGCRVETMSGETLGAVAAVHDFGAGDILEVRDPTGKVSYFEFSRAEAPIVDIAARRIVVAPAAAVEPSDPET